MSSPLRKTDEYSIDSSSPRDLMPTCKLEVPLSITTINLMEVFTQTAEKNRFRTSHQNRSKIKACLEPPMSMKSICCCFESEETETTAVFKIRINEKKCVKSIFIRGISGDPFALSSLIQQFSNKINSQIIDETLEEEDENLSSKNEICSYYEFCKILSSESYSLGKSISEFVEVFQIQTPDDTSEAISLLKDQEESVVGVLFSDYNCGGAYTEKIMLHCRPAVQRYLFTKVGSKVMDLYRAKFYDEDREFLRKKLVVSDALEWMGVSRDNENIISECVEIVNRFMTLSCPAEKINCLNRVTNNELLEYTIDQLEFEPKIVAAVLLTSKIEYPMSEIQFLADWDPENCMALFLRAIKLVINTAI